MENSKNKRANNMLWYVIGICIILITLTSVFMSANRKEPVISDTGSETESVSDSAKETQKSDEVIKETEEVVPKESVKSNETAESDKKDTPIKETAAEKDGYELPVSGSISKGYSIDTPVYSMTMNDYRAHTGIDILCEEGSAVSAAAAGVIKQIYNDPMMGTTVVIEHTDGISTRYMNLNENLPESISVGKSVKSGELIGAVGSSALVEIAQDPHLHFETVISGAYVDPMSVLKPDSTSVFNDSVVE